MNTTIYITRQIEIDVAVEYTPAVKATHLEPPVAAGIDIITAYDQDGEYIELTDAERDEVERLVLESPPERDYDQD
jgi:hypothetical protein